MNASSSAQSRPIEPTQATRGWARIAHDAAVKPRHVGLVAVLVLSGVLEFVNLAQNGFANIYYSAAVKSMLRSWHNFVFISADPNGLITIDKPPLALWLQAASAKVFGFSALSLLIPEAVCAVLAVALMYKIIASRFGAIAGLGSALCLAVFPAFVAVGRDNGVDPLLILLMLASCWAGLAAIESGRVRTLMLCAVLVGLAFETKSLAAMLCVPGIAAAYLVCAPGRLLRRIGVLAAGGVVLAVVALSWPLFVDLTSASQRPFVGGSGASNSELQLELGYNGLGRVVGESGGPGTKHLFSPEELFPLIRPGLTVPSTPAERRYHRAHTNPPPAPPTPPVGGPGTLTRFTAPIPFAGAASPVRIFGTALGDQAGWTVPLALVALIALALMIRARRDRFASALLVFGGWMLAELVVLDFSNGIVHPYYASALAPGLAAVVGAGGVALYRLMRDQRGLRAVAAVALAAAGIGATVAIQLVLIGRERYPTWWRLPLIVLVVVALAALLVARGRRGWALVAAVAALLVAPAVYSSSVWRAPVNGTFPAAGPYSNAGNGGYGVDPGIVTDDRLLIRYLAAHGETAPYSLVTQSSNPAATLILLGLHASSEGGYGSSDDALTNDQLANLVEAGKARYVLLDGPFALRAGNSAVTAARVVCTEIPEIIWGGPAGSPSLLVDCAHKAEQLRHPYQAAVAFLRAHPKVHYELSPAIPR